LDFTGKRYHMKKFILLLVLLLSGKAYSQTVTTASLLKEMTDFNAVTYWPSPYYTTAQASSYDRHSVAVNKPGWFANADYSQFIRTEQHEDHKEYVMLDENGPGALVRFWLTTFKRAGKLRIYFDGNTQPEIIIPAYDLMKLELNPGLALLTPHSSYQPIEKGGSTLYLPMPYAKHCKVTWEDAAPEIKEPRYYQINFRRYKRNTIVQTFSLKEAAQLKNLLEETNEKLLHPLDVTAGTTSLLSLNLLEKGTASLDLPRGQNAVKFLSIEVSSKQLILKIKFDGEQTVSCPVNDFSGSGALQSWYRTVTADGKIISRWVMPYKSTASISFENLSDEAVMVTVKAVTQSYSWNRNSMYFHVNWKLDKKVPLKKWDEPGAIEWRMADIKGKGIFLGDCLSVYNYMHSWYGEGDQKLYIDKEAFPVEYGTGTEDYYNTSWAPVTLYQTPFANAPTADAADSYGNNTFTRTRNLDGVVFRKSFRYDLEMLGWANGEADCAATIYWYGK
jgi:hypothetical protein